MRTKYTGPMKPEERGTIKGGKLANVSREELADFKRRFGQNKTLRDLLNADRTGKLPTPVKQEPPAVGSGRGASAGRTAADRDTQVGTGGRGFFAGRKASDQDTAPMRASSGPAAPYRNKDAEAKRVADARAMLDRMEARDKPRMSASDIPGLVTRGMKEGAERVPAGRGLGATFVGGSSAAPKLASGLASAAKSVPKAVSAAGKTAQEAAAALRARAAEQTAKRSAPTAERVAPTMYSAPPKTGGVWRNTRELELPKPGGTWRSARDEATKGKK